MDPTRLEQWIRRLFGFEQRHDSCCMYTRDSHRKNFDKNCKLCNLHITENEKSFLRLRVISLSERLEKTRERLSIEIERADRWTERWTEATGFSHLQYHEYLEEQEKKGIHIDI